MIGRAARVKIATPGCPRKLGVLVGMCPVGSLPADQPPVGRLVNHHWNCCISLKLNRRSQRQPTRYLPSSRALIHMTSAGRRISRLIDLREITTVITDRIAGGLDVMKPTPASEMSAGTTSINPPRPIESAW